MEHEALLGREADSEAPLKSKAVKVSAKEIQLQIDGDAQQREQQQ